MPCRILAGWMFSTRRSGRRVGCSWVASGGRVSWTRGSTAPEGWWAFVWVTVTEVLDVPRVGVVEARSRYVQWIPADRLASRANDERRPTHPHG